MSLGSPIFRRASRNPRRTQHLRCCDTVARAACVHMIMCEANSICKLQTPLCTSRSNGGEMIERVKVEMCREVTEKGRAPLNVHKQSRGFAASVTAPLNCAKSQEAKLYIHGQLRFPFLVSKILFLPYCHPLGRSPQSYS